MVYNVDLDKLYRHLKQSAKKRNIKFTITKSDLYNLSFPITCPILNMPLDYNTKKYIPNKPSVDRIDNNLGYEPNNLQIISLQANRAKNNLSEKELELFALYFKKVD